MSETDQKRECFRASLVEFISQFGFNNSAKLADGLIREYNLEKKKS